MTTVHNYILAHPAHVEYSRGKDKKRSNITVFSRPERNSISHTSESPQLLPSLQSLSSLYDKMMGTLCHTLHHCSNLVTLGRTANLQHWLIFFGFHANRSLTEVDTSPPNVWYKSQWHSIPTRLSKTLVISFRQRVKTICFESKDSRLFTCPSACLLSVTASRLQYTYCTNFSTSHVTCHRRLQLYEGHNLSQSPSPMKCLKSTLYSCWLELRATFFKKCSCII